MKKLSSLAGGALSAFAAISVCLFAAREANAAYTTDLPASLVNLTGSGTASTTGNIYANEGPATAFDHNTGGTRVIWNQKTNVDLVYEFPEPTRVNAFRIWRTAQYERQPKTFSFQGWDGTDWQTLDGDTGLNKDTDWKPVSYRYYQFVNAVHYKKYRLFIEENGGNTYTEFFEFEMFCVDDGTPVIASHAITVNSATSFDVSVTMGDIAADTVFVKAIDPSGAVAASANLGSLAANGSAVGNLQNLAPGATYQVRVDTASGSLADENPVDTIYTGALTLSDAISAQEAGTIPGSVTVSRAAADDYPLVVNYAFSSSDATPGVTYVVPSGLVVIPAGSASATIEVVPLVDTSVLADAAVTVSLTAGNYALSGSESANVTIVNAAIPSDKNVWIAGAGSDGLASTAANWSKGVPSASEPETLVIFLSGNYSSHDLVWDATSANGLATTVTSWTQADGYSGTATIGTEFSDYEGASFTLFTISGDCTVSAGSLSCHGNYHNYGVADAQMDSYKTDKHYCLNLSVGGNLTVGAGASITATGKGYGYPTSNSNTPQSYGGYGYGGSVSPYGSVKEPFDPGTGSISQTDANNRKKLSAIGGGAIKLAVVGSLTLNGSIVSLGTIDQNIVRSTGTGGSIWITASQISGTGTINASSTSSGLTSDQAVAISSGGRIALYTQSPLALPIANVTCSGAAYKGTSATKTTKVAGPGTIYVYDPTQTYGTLYVKQSTSVATSVNKFSAAAVMGDVNFDAVVLSGYALLRIPAGSSITLPSLSVVTTDNTKAGIAGLVYAGGTLNVGSGNQTLKANVAFSSPTAYSFPADLTLEAGAKLGSVNSAFAISGSCLDNTFTLSVGGNLTIPSGATAGATRCCAYTAASTAQYASHGGQSLWNQAYGGREMTNGYDSVLSPSMPGGSTIYAFMAGGVFNLTVGGTLTLNGTMSSDGGNPRGDDSTYDKQPAGSGGAINVTVGELTGSGAIVADGGCARYGYAGGAGGGRIAVRLTGKASEFSDYWATNILARGVSFAADRNVRASSAGTVYLQAGSDAEAAGTVVIRNDFALQSGATNNLATTRYPGNGDGCDAPDALKKTSLLIAGAAHVELTDAMKAVSLDIESGSYIDLAGKTLNVKSARLGGKRLSPGTYAAGDAAVSGFVTDSGEGGELVVAGGFTLVVR